MTKFPCLKIKFIALCTWLMYRFMMGPFPCSHSTLYEKFGFLQEAKNELDSWAPVFTADDTHLPSYLIGQN